MDETTVGHRVPLVIAICAPLVWLFGGCGVDVTIAETADAGAPPSFVDPDAGTDVVAVETLTAYCPSSSCPAGHTTCPDSRFPCDVDLRSDPEHCGACDSACPTTGDGESYACIDGVCVMACNAEPRTLDCDGAPDNGCETPSDTNENCGACGRKCLDPAKPCVPQGITEMGCGCPDGKIYCADNDPVCVDAKNDDMNCGTCGNACDPSGPDLPPLPDNMIYGCMDGQCGKPKCADGFRNCDGDLTNGCEANIHSDEHCGACGNACLAGTKCASNIFGKIFCACPPGETFCSMFCIGDYCIGECHDLTTDPDNCGACGLSCNEQRPYTMPACTYGTCAQRCIDGRADCNGNDLDGCEIDTKSDPRNCGGCGVVCDAVAGQACVGGQCVVEPCDRLETDGGLPK